MAEGPTVLTERSGPVGVLILNRPSKLNALSQQLLTELEAALEALEADPAVHCLVVTGAGVRAFSAGGDLSELGQDGGVAQVGARAPISVLMRARKLPVLAAIRGYCFGGGALLSLGCDIRIGAPDARFKFHGASYGVVAGAAQLPRIVGLAKAKELLLSGDEIGAETALRIGLLNHVVPAAEVVAFTVAMGERIAANSPAAVAALRDVLDSALSTEDALQREQGLNNQMIQHADTHQRIRRAAERVLGTPG